MCTVAIGPIAHMAWLLFSVLPNLDLQFNVEARECVFLPSDDAQVKQLRKQHPHLNVFLRRFRTAHRRIVKPAVMLLDSEAPDSRRSSEAMVALRNCLSVAVLLHEHALKLSYPHQNRLLYSDAFEFYPWTLDVDFDHMTSITPAIWAIHQVEEFTGQPLAGVPVHSLRANDVDRPLFEQLAAHWDAAFAKPRMSAFDRVLFRSLNMANAALAMPAARGATFFDYGRQCALWISAFEILAHHDSGRNRADLSAVLDLLTKKPLWFRKLNARRYTIRHQNRSRRVGLPGKLYAQLYKVRNDFLHGNPVSVRTLLLRDSRRFIGDFAPLLYRCALRNYLDLRFVPDDEPDGAGAQQDVHDYEEPQYDVEQALALARVRPNDDD